MNLKELQNVQQRNHQVNSRRAVSSDQYYQQGLEQFELAISENFSNAERLPQACQFFIQALKSNRADERPSLMLAYLFMLLQDFDTALDYLKPVLESKPEHPQALEIKATIQKKIQRQGPQKQDASHETDLTEADYAQTRQWILQAVRFSMEKPLPPPAFNEAAIQDLQKQARMLSKQHQSFQEQIEKLEAEFEVQELQQLLQPLEAQMKRWQRLITDSEAGAALFVKLQEELSQVEQLLNEIPNLESREDLEIMEENYEILMDNAESYVEKVEQLSQNHPVNALNDLYEQLSDKIATFADDLDECASRFKS